MFPETYIKSCAKKDNKMFALNQNQFKFCISLQYFSVWAFHFVKIDIVAEKL